MVAIKRLKVLPNHLNYTKLYNIIWLGKVLENTFMNIHDTLDELCAYEFEKEWFELKENLDNYDE